MSPDVLLMAGTGLGLGCLMEIRMEAYREPQVLSKALEWGYADALNFRIQLLCCSSHCAGTYLFAYTLFDTVMNRATSSQG